MPGIHLGNALVPAPPVNAVIQHTQRGASLKKESIHNRHPAPAGAGRQLPAPAWPGREGCPPSIHKGVSPPHFFLRPTVCLGCWTKCSLNLCSEHLINKEQINSLLELREHHSFNKTCVSGLHVPGTVLGSSARAEQPRGHQVGGPRSFSTQGPVCASS